MIQLGSYSKDFENEYWGVVCKKIDDKTQKEIIESCVKFLPSNFFEENDDEQFKYLVLAPFDKLKYAEEYISNSKIEEMEEECFYKSKNGKKVYSDKYKFLYDSYYRIANASNNNISMRVNIVKNTGVTVCPYCNRDYINCRGEKTSGAQLDHFFNKARFPIFAISLYNLVPVCGNCNRIKSDKLLQFVSPFDNSINWQEDIFFSYKFIKLKDVEITIRGNNKNLQNNIEAMGISKAYQIHGNLVLELIENLQIYNKTQNQEIKEVFSKIELTDSEIKKAIFGPEITKECMRTKPLGKMMSDLHKKMKIY